MRFSKAFAIFIASFCLIPFVVQAQHVPPESAPVVQPGAPGEPSKTLPPSTTAPAPQLAKADIDFMQGMIMHHAQAVEMAALIPSHTQNKALRSLGKRISLSQTDEMKFMRHWLEARSEPTSMDMSSMDTTNKSMPMMPGMLTPQQMDSLRHAKGADFDHQFLTGMIQHHGGALTMAKDLFDSPGAGQDADLFDFATDVDNTQRAEIKLMERLLKENQ